MRVLDIPSASLGERVQHEFLVLEREERRQANGDPYVILTLGNATGRIATAPVWLNQLEWVAGAEKGRVVQAIGEIGAFQHRRQLRLTSALRVIPAESVVPESFLARTAIPGEQLWDWIDRARADIKSTTLRRAVDTFFADDAFRVEFEQLPASIGGHHAVVGGLLLHTTEVATLARSAARLFKANTDLAIAGALLHDVGKVRAFLATPTGFVWTPAGRLAGLPALAATVLSERLASLLPNDLTDSQLAELHHLAQCAQNEGSILPLTIEAEILRGANALSARVADMSSAFADDMGSGDDGGDEANLLRGGRRTFHRPHSWD